MNVESKVQQQLRAKTGTPLSSANTPSVGPKKKISLAAYKNKQAGGADGTPTPSVPEKAQKDIKNQDGTRKEPEHSLDKPKEQLQPKKQATREVSPSDVLKRKRETQDSVSQNQAVKRAEKLDSPAPPKKARMSSPEQSKALPPPLSPLSSPAGAKGLPGKLSPLRHLPGRLSPTLPDSIVASLNARAHKRSASDSSNASGEPSSSSMIRTDSKHDSVLSASRDGTQDKSSPRGVATISQKEKVYPEKPDVATKALPKRVSEGRPGEARKEPQAAVPPDVVSTEKYPKPSNVTKREQQKDIGRTNRLVVKLRVPKHRRTDLKRLLGMRPSPQQWQKELARFMQEEEAEEKPSKQSGDVGRRMSAQSRPGNRNGSISDEPIKGVARKVKSSHSHRREGREEEISTSTASKRPRAEDEASLPQPEAKRKKLGEILKSEKEKTSSTPLQPAFQSPAVPSGSAQKSQQLTPSMKRDRAADLRPTAMQRVSSHDSQADTPTAHNGNTPTTTAPTSQASAPNSTQQTRPSPSSASRTPASQAWLDEQNRLAKLGKDLKHRASSYMSNTTNSTNTNTNSSHAAPGPNGPKLAALTALESLLTYLLAFSASDMSYTTRSPPLPPPYANTWATLHGFFAWVKRLCAPFPHLLGLANQLGVVYAGRIVAVVSQGRRLDAEEGRTLAGACLLVRECAVAGRAFGVEVVMDSFPRTWEGRVRGGRAGAGAGAGTGAGNGVGVEVDVKPRAYGGGYGVPVGIETGPVEAVRFGVQVLREWAAREGVEFSMGLVLGDDAK
ncbi:hypothetical protein M8818_006306 [Zalaria obscura]|uniref:Uncharacterized protein n=1 Tax=Zalaria obscura TaxID=2024903 RepID=A0ACC3S831_9PEZI